MASRKRERSDDLPEGWTSRLSRSRGIPVFTHTATGITQWTQPPHPTPVSTHYDAITTAAVRGGRGAREGDRALGVRLWHNACKAHLIQRAAALVPRGPSILDLACGKLGDGGKWARLNPSAFTGLDISVECVKEATRRASTMLSRMPTPAKIEVADLSALPAGWKPAAPATLVAMHFAINYLGKGLSGLQALFAFAGAHASRGAAFLVTFTNWEALSRSLSEEGKAASDIHRVEVLGERHYVFSLGDGCVDECPEFGVSLVDLETAGARCGWRLQEAHGSLADLDLDPGLVASMRAARLSGSEAAVSSLYSAAIFVKASG